MPKDVNNENLPQELQAALRDLVNAFEQEDSWVRKQQIKLWKKNEEFWHGVQFIFWSESRQDWIAPVEASWFQQGENREGAEGPFYDFVVNIYRAHGEAIISALSAAIPAIHFPPDDADNEEDLITSKAYSKIADVIQKHNRAKILSLRALFTLFNQGIVAAYHPSVSDKSFGTHTIPQYENRTVMRCQSCDMDVESEICPQCLQPATPDERVEIAGFTELPKHRVIVDVFGPLHVKIPYAIRQQKDAGYLILSMDLHKSLLKSTYPHVADKIEASHSDVGEYERVARAPASYSSYGRTEEDYLHTLRRVWIRPWAFEGIADESTREQIKKLYPTGCYVALIGNTYVESRNEDLDEYWTIGQAGLSSYIHSDPLGQSLVPIQEARNALFNLTLETIEHGIPSGFADPEVLDFEVYSKHEASPGMKYPAKAKRAGEPLNNYFYEEPRASVSREVALFQQQIDHDAQFVTGSFPSIYGGPGEGKSRTYAEYAASRQMALQRLSIAWTLYSDWWARLMEKCVKLYISNMIEDERFVTRDNGTYVNVWVRRAELTGRIGGVEPEGSETFPISSGQKRDLLMQLLQLNNDFVNSALFDIENRRVVSESMSFPDLYIPGEDQRIKQVQEIRQMLKGTPVNVEPEVDDDEVHIATLKRFLSSLPGMHEKITNPEGYSLCIQHLAMHQQVMEQKTQQQFEGSMPGEKPEQGVQ